MTAKDENAKQRVAEEVWLRYFNQFLFENGIISERTRNRMHVRILTDSKKRERNAAGQRSTVY